MILRSCLVACGLLCAYQLVVGLAGTRRYFHVQSLWQDNLIRCQDYVLRPPPPAVVVGTSLSRGFSGDALGPDFYNLAVTGGNVLTGLDTVLRAGPKPRIVIIETSRLMQDGAEGVEENVFRPGFLQLRPHFASLRERYQPANLGAWVLAELALRPALNVLQVPVQSAVPAGSRRDEKRFPALLALTRESHSHLHDEARLVARCDALRVRIDRLKQLGITAVLLDMPFDSSLADAPAVAQQRRVIDAAFPAASHPWIRPAADHHYATTDGIHLTESELRDYAATIRATVARLPAPPAR